MSDWRLFMDKEGEYRNTKGELVGYRRGNEIRNIKGELVGYVQGGEVRDISGELLGYIRPKESEGGKTW